MPWIFNKIAYQNYSGVKYIEFEKKKKLTLGLHVPNLSPLTKTGLLIFRGKKSKISRDFQGQIRGKIGQFRGIFAGKKSKFVEKSADFVRFSLEKSQNLQKNRPIPREFSGKKSNFEGFSGAIS